ncbi:Facilitated trehalose transporter Tret1-2-like [Papilio xuthus]|uniref:Facilitated trehalose transporter Tret1-2-like n=1 Tax=Papilio xuthus TaxID=66420 RepID=A0A194Q550_PAPXU|nr:Facilitated trehalose transporter Tret1-2-like [Papilio xuthus]
MLTIKRVYLIKQLVATSVSGFLSLCGGLAFGFSAVLLPQLKADENYPYDENYVSWIAAMTPLSMVLGCLCAGSIIDRIGRKMGHIILAFFFVISWTVQAFASNNPVMLLGRFLTGLCSGAIRPITLVYLGEIADPKYRGLMLFSPSLTLSLGVVINHALGGFVFWRTNALICNALSIISIVLLLVLKESPLWLIAKGKIDEGVKVFKWFRGDTDEAEKELNLILEKQNEKKVELTVMDYFKIDFMKPLLITFFLSVAMQFSGANIITFYAQDILGQIIPNDYDPFILMIVADCIRFIAASSIFFFGTRIPRKIAFFVSNFGACTLLYCLLLFLYLNPPNMRWVSLVLLIAYMTFSSAIVTLSWSFVAELYPSKLRGVGSGASSAVSYFLLFISVKITPGITSTLGVLALFCMFATITVLNGVILIFLLPETHGRSLQDIEDGYKKSTVSNVEVSKL